MKVAICIPSYGFVHPAIYANHISVLMKWHKKYEISIMTVDGCKCAQARNHLVRGAMEGACTHLLFIDIDHIMPVETLDLLLSDTQAAVVSALICKRKFPFPQVGYVFSQGGYHAIELPLDDKVYNVCICAIGCTLSKMEIFVHLDQPFFKDVEGFVGDDKRSFNKRHDVNFFERVRDIGGVIQIDTRVQVGHMGDPYVAYPHKHPPERHQKKEEVKK